MKRINEKNNFIFFKSGLILDYQIILKAQKSVYRFLRFNFGYY